MIPIEQTKVVVKKSDGTYAVRGNCYAAAIASLLEIPITEVPNVEVLFHISDFYWDDVMNKWLDSKGYYIENAIEYACFHRKNYEEIFEDSFDSEKAQALRAQLKDTYYLVSGDSVRGVSHITIWKNGEMVHDPHPTKEGLATIKYFQILKKNSNHEQTNPASEALQTQEINGSTE